MVTDDQLQAIGQLHHLFEGHGVAHWLFGGWAVDFHAGQVTRRHADIDVAVWRDEVPRMERLLNQEGWHRGAPSGEDGYAVYENGSLRLDLAFLPCTSGPFTSTPGDADGAWPVGSFGDDVEVLGGIRAHVVSLASLVADKSERCDDPTTRQKDGADIAVLSRLASTD